MSQGGRNRVDRLTKLQVAQFVNVMNQYPDLAKGRLVNGSLERRRSLEKWAELAAKANLECQTSRTIAQWKAVWDNLKKNTKKTYGTFRRQTKGTGRGGPPPSITSSHQMVLDLMAPETAVGVAIKRESASPTPTIASSPARTTASSPTPTIASSPTPTIASSPTPTIASSPTPTVASPVPFEGPDAIIIINGTTTASTTSTTTAAAPNTPNLFDARRHPTIPRMRNIRSVSETFEELADRKLLISAVKMEVENKKSKLLDLQLREATAKAEEAVVRLEIAKKQLQSLS